MDRHKYRIYFSKGGAMRFIGHLDLLRLFQRAIKRSGLPVAYSSGFNPHQLISFAMPLPIGYSGSAECADIEFERPPSDIAAALAAQMPGGLVVTSARPFYKDEKPAAALTAAAVYEIEFPKGICPGLSGRAMEIGAAESIVIEKKTKSGSAMADIRPDIISIEAEGNAVRATLSSGSARNLKPELLAGHILGGAPCDPFAIKYRRVAMLMKTGGGYSPL